MTSEPELYLHIGHPKSGSTTLQQFLYRNWQPLSLQGVELPTATLAPSSATTPPDNPLWSLKADADAGHMARVEAWVEAVTQTRTHAQKLLLSSELLFNPGHAALFADLSSRMPVHLIYYIRRQDELLLSAWRQWGLKRGLSLDELISRRLRNNQPDFAAVIAEWQAHVQLASCHIRFIGRQFLTDGSLSADLCAAMGISSRGLIEPQQQNQSLDGRLLHFMSRHADFFDNPHDDGLLQLLQDPDAPRRRAKLSEDQFTRIQAHFEPGNQDLLRRFHSSHTGHAVVDRTTAPVFARGEDITRADQVAYIRAQLDRLASHTDPRLEALRKTIEQER